MTKIEFHKENVQIMINYQLETIHRAKERIMDEVNASIIHANYIQSCAMDIAQAQAELKILMEQMRMLERLEDAE